jgi:hypothetical protein
LQTGAIWQPSSCPALMIASSAALFITGSAPGSASTTGSVSVFTSCPYPAATRVNIFDWVLIWTWTSRPMTAS